ncbi:hypothetical protein EL17_16670 [Anditalea andensis]|uniref:Uncharacterized protein n=1 Tax=Anditalea andensis TaxID=1048983 RepID=A0A074KTY7_9BACT|nr:hypothetical protein EL17_16670 [Anditalea andensis]
MHPAKKSIMESPTNVDRNVFINGPVFVLILDGIQLNNVPTIQENFDSAFIIYIFMNLCILIFICSINFNH